MKKWKKILPVLSGAVLVLTILLLWGPKEPEVRAAGGYPAKDRGSVLIIDAGHGGEDGGAVSLTGASESQINLAIARRTDLILGLYGVPVVMLREKDISLHDPGCSTLREKKVSDLHNRTALVESQENGVLLSIHQNSYPAQKYSGAQVFYAPTPGSEELALLTQEVLRDALDPDNGRKAKPIPDTVYLLNHISCRAVLVECGFLTNPQEERQLLDSGYQCKIAAALAGAWLQYRQVGGDGDIAPHVQ